MYRPHRLDGARARLGVVQVLVLALLATLGGRLWYLQVRSGAQFQAAAAAIAVSAGSARATNVPKRPRVSTTPAVSSSRYARATVLTARPSPPANSRTVGNRAPGGRVPARIASMIWLRS